MRLWTRLFPIFLIIFSLKATSSVADPECSKECANLIEQSQEFQKGIDRLKKVKAMNLEFIASLDPGQDGQRLKAQSNLNIAEKRIQDLEHKLQESQKNIPQLKCESCPNG